MKAGEAAESGDIVAAVLPGLAEDEAMVSGSAASAVASCSSPTNPAMEPFEMDPAGGSGHGRRRPSQL